MAEGRHRLHALEREASAWMAAHPAPADTAALFDAFLTIPYLRDLTSHHPGYVAKSEQTLETTFCVGHDGGLPLPLPQSRAQCACAELGGVAVERIHLSGSVRECSDVRLFPEEASDIDVMLQLGPVNVEVAGEPQESDQEAGAGSQEASVVGQQEAGESGQEALTSFKQEAGTGCQKTLVDSKQEPGSDAQKVQIDDKQEEGTGRQEALVVVNQEAGGIGLVTLEVDGQEVVTSGPEPPTVGYQEVVEDVFLSCENDREAPPIDGASADRPAPDPPTGITVTGEPAGHRGFFLLRHRRLASCRHRGLLPLSARRVVALMDSFRAAITREAPTVSGPAVSTTIKDVFRDPKAVDLVACVRCPSWPSAEYATRPRPSGRPSAELVARLCRTAAFLVPVGFPGSETEGLEWRLSFSRHEYIAFRSMTEAQMVCLTTLKHCKAVVGEAARPLKSYYLKTALMWLVESRAADQWTLETMHESLLLILRYLEVCLRHGHLPCYFWPEVNLFASRSAAELVELSAAVAVLRRRLLPAVLALLADWLGQPVPELAERLLRDGRRLSEDEFWGMTGVHAVQDLTSGDRRRRRPLDVLRDLAFNGKLGASGNMRSFPLCSALALGVEAGREFNRRMKREGRRGCGGMSREVRNVVGLVQPIFKLVQQVRRPGEPDDSWMRED